MKKILMTMLFGGSVFFAFSQHRYNPPTSVRNSFHREYPQSQPTQWNHSQSGWSVSFEDRDHNNGEATAHFDGSGRHIDTHVLFDNNDVPAPVMHNVQNRYPGADDYEVTRIQRRGGNGLYRVHFRHKTRYRTVYVDERGRDRDFRDRH